MYSGFGLCSTVLHRTMDATEVTVATWRMNSDMWSLRNRATGTGVDYIQVRGRGLMRTKYSAHQYSYDLTLER